MILLFIEIALTIIAGVRGWWGWALLPGGVPFLIGFWLGVTGNCNITIKNWIAYGDPYILAFLSFFDIVAIVILMVMCIWCPKKKEK